MVEIAILVFTLLLVAAFVFLVFGKAAVGFLLAAPKFLLLFAAIASPVTIYWFWRRRRRNGSDEFTGETFEEKAAALRREMEVDLRHEPERRTRVKVNALETLATLRDAVASDFLILDTRAWMDDRLYSFFRALRRCAVETQTEMLLHPDQFNDICHRKRSALSDSTAHRTAGVAIHRIEQFQSEGLLRLHGAAIAETGNPDADPLEVRILVAEATPGKSICFISDEIELRIRVRELLRRHPVGQWKVLELADLISGCEAVVEAEKLGLFNPEPSAVIHLCPPAAS